MAVIAETRDLKTNGPNVSGGKLRRVPFGAAKVNAVPLGGAKVAPTERACHIPRVQSERSCRRGAATRMVSRSSTRAIARAPRRAPVGTFSLWP